MFGMNIENSLQICINRSKSTIAHLNIAYKNEDIAVYKGLAGGRAVDFWTIVSNGWASTQKIQEQGEILSLTISIASLPGQKKENNEETIPN